MKKLMRGLVLLGLLPGASYAVDCGGLATYTPKTYQTGDKVIAINKAFSCTVGGWCSIGGPYEPGVGWAAQHAWTDLGTCSATSSVSSVVSSSSIISSSKSSLTSSVIFSSSSSVVLSSSRSSISSSRSSMSSSSAANCPAYKMGAAYAAGAVVAHVGGFYQCTVPGWCSLNSAAYEPGKGWAYAGAWSTTTAAACGGGGDGSSSSTSSGSTVPNEKFCAMTFKTGVAYSKGSLVGYKGVVYRALVDTHSIAPDNTAYPGQWAAAGYVDDSLCPVPIPNTINYGIPKAVDGNVRAGLVNPTGSVGSVRISDTQSTLTGVRGGTDAKTDRGGSHPGLDSNNGARVSKVKPATSLLQHNKYSVTSGTEVVSYIGDWAIYGRGYDFSKLPIANLNRIVYGFAGICFPGAKNEQDGGFPTSAPAAVLRTCKQSKLPDGAMALADFEAAFVRNVGVPAKIVGTESMYEINKEDVGGVFGVLYNLRKQNPDLKLDLSVGGWTLSEGFPWMASDNARRKAFVDSIVHFLDRYDYDGIDIDWEYPGSDGAVPGMARPDDSENYAKLMQELRAGMDWLSKKTGKSYRLSSAIPAGKGRLDKVNWGDVYPYMDRLYAMTYDLTGAWERELSHHTPLYANPNAIGSSAGTSVDFTIKYLQSLGVPANKLMVGVANYHRARAMNTGDITEFTNGLTGNSSFGSASWAGGSLILGVAGVGTWEAGVVEGYDLYQNYLDKDMRPRNGYKLYTDVVANADYLVSSIGSFITIETPRTAALKTQYAKDNGLAGVFFWMAEQDNGYNLNAVNHVLGNPLQSDVADGKPQHQIPVCGENVTAMQCEQLINSLR
jgi:chitinase